MGNILSTKVSNYTPDFVSFYHLGLWVLASQAYDSCDLGKSEAVPELVIPTHGLSFVQ